MTLTRLCFSSLALLLLGCGGGGDKTPAPPVQSVPAPVVADRFATVDATTKAAFDSAGIPGMGLTIYDRAGTKVFERMYGDFSAERRVAIASASKWVSGMVLLRLVDKGYLSLESTTGQILGWSGAQAAITLRHLLSFTSGLPANHTCTLRSNISLAQCVELISQESLVAAPGTRFDYGSTHLQVAARMAEVLVGSNWNAIFAAELQQPLGLPADLAYYTAPQQIVGTSNPLIAGGLRASMNDYARVLQFVFDNGKWQGSALMGEALFNQQSMEPYPAAVVANSPMQAVGLSYRYGLAAWLECSTPASGCAAISSPGAFGFTPWLDRDSGYFAILGMEVSGNDTGIVPFAVSLEQQVKPLIAAAITK